MTKLRYLARARVIAPANEGVAPEVELVQLRREVAPEVEVLLV
jgi:hypothetical protein